jgi:hypothetical protein
VKKKIGIFFFGWGRWEGVIRTIKRSSRKKKKKIKYKKFKNCGQVLMQGLIGTFYRLL